jgi:hypothetical protein
MCGVTCGGSNGGVAGDARRSVDRGTLDASTADGGCGKPATCPIYVDASAAAGGNGSALCPFRTITAALGAVLPDCGLQAIRVAPGTYDATLGESFPLYVPTMLGVIAATPTSPLPVIDGVGAEPGAGNVTIELAGTLQNIKVIDSSGTADAIIDVQPSVLDSFASLYGQVSGGRTAAIWLRGGASPVLFTVTTSLITGSQGDGIRVDAAAAQNLVEVLADHTQITGNAGNGVNVLGPTCASTPKPYVDLGTCPGHTMQSNGQNQIFCNTAYGVQTAVAMDACNDAWNHDPPTTTSTHPDYSGAVSVAGALAATGSCP